MDEHDEPSDLDVPHPVSWRGVVFWAVFIVIAVSFALVQLTNSNKSLY